MSALALPRCDAGGGNIHPTQQLADAGFFTSSVCDCGISLSLVSVIDNSQQSVYIYSFIENCEPHRLTCPTGLAFKQFKALITTLKDVFIRFNLELNSQEKK